MTTTFWNMNIYLLFQFNPVQPLHYWISPPHTLNTLLTNPVCGQTNQNKQLRENATTIATNILRHRPKVKLFLNHFKHIFCTQPSTHSLSFLNMNQFNMSLSIRIHANPKRVWCKQYKGENRRWLSQRKQRADMGVGGVGARQAFADGLMTGWSSNLMIISLARWF